MTIEQAREEAFKRVTESGGQIVYIARAHHSGQLVVCAAGAYIPGEGFTPVEMITLPQHEGKMAIYDLQNDPYAARQSLSPGHNDLRQFYSSSLRPPESC